MVPFARSLACNSSSQRGKTSSGDGKVLAVVVMLFHLFLFFRLFFSGVSSIARRWHRAEGVGAFGEKQVKMFLCACFLHFLCMASSRKYDCRLRSAPCLLGSFLLYFLVLGGTHEQLGTTREQ